MTAGLRALQRTSAASARPLSVHLELTYRCNARCGHCLQDRGAAGAELSLDHWVAVLEDARRLGALFASISGGEALLSPHFWGVAENARRLGYAIRVYTNGLRLDRATVARLAGLAPYSVEVSIFSTEPARHDAVLGVPGAFGQVLKGLVRLRRAGVHTVLKCPLLAGTADDHPRVRRLAERLGAEVQFDAAIFTATDGRSGPTRCRGEDAAVQAFFADTAARGDSIPRAPAPPSAAPCGMARTFVVVGPSGEVHPCVAMPLSAGNVRQAPLDELWRRAPLLERLRARTHGALPVCGTCERSGYCGRCSALALLEDGDLDGPSSRACHVAELRERAWGLPPPAGAPEGPRARTRLRVLG